MNARSAAPDAAPDAATLRRILRECRTVAIVGLSAEPHRPSYFVASYLQGKGYRIVPVNPKYPRILGQTSYARLEDIPFAVDMVDVFRKPAELPPIAASAVAIGAKCLWQQLGVANAEADAIARAAGLDSVMDRCVKIEHARLFGGLHWVGVDTRVISAKRPQGGAHA
jgi:predicted CoA-binding protein